VPSVSTTRFVAALLSGVALAVSAAAPASATGVRFYGADGRQVEAVDAQNVNQAVSSFQRARRSVGAERSDAVTGCPIESTFKAFARLGDSADYALAPGGTFEGRAEGWELTDAMVTSGNETVGILPGSRSLLIGARGSAYAAAYTPEICVDPSKPTFRFLMRAARATTGIVTTLRFHPKDHPALTVEVDSAKNAAAGTDWVAAEPNELATKIAGQLMNDTGQVQIGFRPVDARGASATAQIDNLLIDPYRRG
jgi:hypothetical protein